MSSTLAGRVASVRKQTEARGVRTYLQPSNEAGSVIPRDDVERFRLSTPRPPNHMAKLRTIEPCDEASVQRAKQFQYQERLAVAREIGVPEDLLELYAEAFDGLDTMNAWVKLLNAMRRH